MAKPFPVQDSTISATALARSLVSLYELSPDTRCRFFRKGICDTYQVRDGDQRYFLKVYRSGRRCFTDVTEEVRLLRHLRAGGVSVVEPIARIDGQFVNEIRAPEGRRYSVLFRAADGETEDNGNIDRIKSFGKMVGKMHKSCDSFQLPYKRSLLDIDHLVDENLSAISRLMQHRPNELAVIRSIAEESKQIPLLKTTTVPEFGVCHGDLHGGDVAYDSDNHPTIFDFDSSGSGWRAFDIGVFPASVNWMDTSREMQITRKKRLDAFLDGYSSTRILNEQELFAVSQMAPIYHIYLMGFVLRYSAIWRGDYWADDSFIDWHMAWFNTWIKDKKTT